jgi:hypothetical protein
LNKVYTAKEQKEIERVKEIMKTEKQTKCNGECCTIRSDPVPLNKNKQNIPKGSNVD